VNTIHLATGGYDGTVHSPEASWLLAITDTTVRLWDKPAGDFPPRRARPGGRCDQLASAYTITLSR
jgi:hypothetical protein